MTPQEKGVYEKRAKDAKVTAVAGNAGERYTSQGVSFSEIDRARGDLERSEAKMQQEISQTVKESYLNNSE